MKTSMTRVSAAASLLAIPTLGLAQDSHNAPNYLIVFGAMALAVIVVFLIVSAVARTSKARFEMIRMLIEKNQEIPPQLMSPHQPQMPRPLTAAEYRGFAVGWGVTWTALAVGLGLTMYIIFGELRFAAWGLIPLCLGIGSFINAALIHHGMRKQANNP